MLLRTGETFRRDGIMRGHVGVPLPRLEVARQRARHVDDRRHAVAWGWVQRWRLRCTHHCTLQQATARGGPEPGRPAAAHRETWRGSRSSGVLGLRLAPRRPSRQSRPCSTTGALGRELAPMIISCTHSPAPPQSPSSRRPGRTPGRGYVSRASPARRCTGRAPSQNAASG